MASSQHATDIPSQTPRREVINNEVALPPLEDIPTVEARYFEITNEQLRALRPVARNLIRDLRYTPIMEFLDHTRTPADNITRNGVLVRTVPELVNTMIEDLARAVQENDPVTHDSEGFPDTEPFPEPQPDSHQWTNNQVYSPREGEGERRNEREGNTARRNAEEVNRPRRNEGRVNRGHGRGGRGDTIRGLRHHANHNHHQNQNRPPPHNWELLRNVNNRERHRDEHSRRHERTSVSGTGSESEAETRNHQRPRRAQPLAWMAQSPLALLGPLHDCLLYTSPSPRDLSTSRMPSSA